MAETNSIIYYSPGFDFPPLLIQDENDLNPWDPDNTEDDALRYHRSDMRTLENLLLTYQECDCEKDPEVLAAIKTVRDSLFKL